jgi:protein-S-isoprenylcysteine O-methyltransferase Ste14
MNVTTLGGQRLSLPFLLDWGERLAVAGLFAWIVHAKTAAHEVNWFFWLYLLSEGLVVGFILARRGTDKVTPRPFDWFLAISATLLPMFVSANPPVEAARFQVFASIVSVGTAIYVVGACWQIWAKLTLRRSFGIVAANRGVKSSGPYRYMRHPMYFGYLMTHIGMFIVSPNLWNIGIYAFAWLFQIMRLMAEERLLTEDATYQEYTQRTRYRLIPGVF